MNALKKRKLLKKILQKLEEEVALVEGKKDVEALAQAGVSTGKAIAVQGNKPERVVNAVKHSVKREPAVLLFDFDEEGKRKTLEYERELSAAGVRVDRQARKAFRALFRLRTIEELPRALHEVCEELKLNG